MAFYKVWLTVKDSYGNTKELEAGTINVDLTNLSEDEVSQIEEALPLEDYIKRSELPIELDEYATEIEVDDAIKRNDAIRYTDFELKENGGNN